MYSHCTVIYPWFLCFMDPPIPVWNGGFINHTIFMLYEHCDCIVLYKYNVITVQVSPLTPLLMYNLVETLLNLRKLTSIKKCSP